MKILSIIALLFLIHFASWGQYSSAAEQLEFTNPAYHVNPQTHSKGYLASSLNINTAYFGWNKLDIHDLQNYLRFQQSIGSWKFGINASHSRLWGVQNSTELGISIAKDIALKGNWSLRPALSAQVNTLHYPTFIELNNQLFDLSAGVLVRYKDWHFYGGVNSFYSSMAPIYYNDTFQLFVQRPIRSHIGIKKTFQIDSVQHIHSVAYYENQNGFHYFNASTIYQRKAQSFLLGLSVNQLSFGFGPQLANEHQFMLSLNLNQPSLLNNSIIRYGVQLNYKWYTKM